MKIIIASDIFGRTPELEEFADALSSNSINATILDPYQGKGMAFKDESEAYSSFQKNVGMEQYKDYILKAIKQIINDSLDNLLLVGFSVGASAIWALSGKIFRQEKIKTVCFYGSQIRYYSEINPKIKIELFFPEYEPHFNVLELISTLSHKKNVKCHMVPYLHGFMNKKSDNFNKTGYHHYLQILKKQMV